MANFILDSVDGILGNGNDVIEGIGVENEPPVANDDNFTTEENVPLNISAAALLENDTDPDEGDVLTIVDTGAVENGTLVENPENTFFGAIEHVGTVTFNDAITVGDFTIGFDPARVGGERSGFFVADNVDLGTILFDLSVPETLEIDETEAVIAGTDLLVSEEFAAILESPDFAGTDLTGADVGNVRSDAETAEDEPGIFTVEGGVTSVDLDNALLEEAANLTVTGADSDAEAAEGFDVGFEIIDETDFGLVEGPTFTFTPDEDFDGEASFEYTISDGSEEDTATVTITVEPVVVNEPPTVTDAAFTVDETAVAGDPVGTVVAEDADGTIESFAIIDGNIDADEDGEAPFAIDNSGQITVNDAEDIVADSPEDPFALTVEATDDAGATAEGTVDIDVVAGVDGNTFNAGEDDIPDLTGNGVVDQIVYEIDSSSGIAIQQEGANGEISITGFNTAEDILQFDDANPDSTLTPADFREGADDDDGAEIQSIGVLDQSAVTLEPDADLNQGTITLLGVTDADAVNIEII
ncbi:MAG: hypothetical protein GVY17_03310 [Cyanobacteria bacterium]|jgi:hypothetical protein|nr:hypothetical protein [Cyanobacteria bacterium GSL.Bin21]